ncbi:DUF5018-related domain-containing protein [Sphingobacterium detergens]|uniref:DUF5018 domain-containing protein n=1 Tax=Sphingobacterium detergens TaxID=1145106 RepID=A0A420BK05_SPHD1|nr:hypothetical protein [Sphingobacterium detergens]RKE57052.1 hypothetical protein DFQ12_1928 [Sphingobacterium detergens]
MHRINHKIGRILLGALTLIAMGSCLKKGYEELPNSPDNKLTAVSYSYRFLYNDTIQKGTPMQEIELDRVCEIVFKNMAVAFDTNGQKGYTSTISYDINSVKKAGPSGSVTKQMLFDEFKKRIQKDQLANLWVTITVSDVSVVSPLNGSPVLGKPGDFSQDRMYRVTAANGDAQDYTLKTIKGF